MGIYHYHYYGKDTVVDARDTEVKVIIPQAGEHRKVIFIMTERGSLALPVGYTDIDI